MPLNGYAGHTPLRLSPIEMAERAKQVRRNIIRMNANAGQGHTGADLSETDILVSLYFRLLEVHGNYRDDPDRNRFIMSKGHGVGGLYCTLAEAGLIEEDLLLTYLQYDSALPGHPVRQKTPYVELNTGALGHGMPVATGLALSAKKSGSNFKVFVLTGDGELQEGSNWEAAMTSAQYQLDNLIVIIDRNTLQLADRTENIIGLDPLDDKWRAFGFDTHICDGNDIADFVNCVESLDMSIGKPHAIIAKTTKGKGVSFMEDRPEWHHRVPKGDEIEQALTELT